MAIRKALVRRLGGGWIRGKCVLERRGLVGLGGGRVV